MAFKDFLEKIRPSSAKSGGQGGAVGEEELTIDDLITLERYEEARTKLKKRVKHRPNDYRSRIQLADVYLKTGEPTEGIAEYLSIADRYTRDGFFDRGHALLSKLSRMMPGEERLLGKMASIERAKRLDHRRDMVVDSLIGKSWAFEVRKHWPDLVRGPLVEVLSEEQLGKLMPAMDFRRFKKGELLARRDEKRVEMFTLVTGSVAAEVELATGATTELRIFHGGDMVGDRALFRREPWPANYRALEKTLALVLDRRGVQQALTGEEDPRAFLDTLQIQRLDTDIADAIGKIKAAHPAESQGEPAISAPSDAPGDAGGEGASEEMSE